MKHELISYFSDYKISWLNTGMLTLSAPVLDQFFPVISQIVLVLCLQVISIGADHVRKKLKLKKRSETDIKVPDNEAKETLENNGIYSEK
ncbi:hypothetical protein AAH994_06105 [Weeksellaceae bacterium A-14]